MQSKCQNFLGIYLTIGRVYLQIWPRLQRLSAKGVFHDFDNTNIFSIPSNLRGLCPALRDITITSALGANQLRSLSEMAPNIERFVASIGSDTGATNTLETCLQTWSSTLSDLGFDSGGMKVAFARPSLREVGSLVLFATSLSRTLNS